MHLIFWKENNNLQQTSGVSSQKGGLVRRGVKKLIITAQREMPASLEKRSTLMKCSWGTYKLETS